MVDPKTCIRFIPVALLTLAAPAMACPDAASCVSQAADAYRAGEFTTALDLFREAQIYDTRPGVDWNTANLLAELGRDAEAVEAFAQFVADHPEDARVAMAHRKRALALSRLEPPMVRVEVAAPDGASVRIAEHRGPARFGAEVPADAPVQVTVGGLNQPPPAPDLATPGWIALGAGVAAGVASGALLSYADREARRVVHMETQAARTGMPDFTLDDLLAAEDAAERGRLTGLVFGGLAAASLSAGVVLLSLDALSATPTPSVSIAPDGVAIRGVF